MKKQPCHTKLCDFETSKSKSEVSKSNSNTFSGKLLIFRKLRYLVISQNDFYHKNLLGKEQWRAVDSQKHYEKGLPLK